VTIDQIELWHVVAGLMLQVGFFVVAVATYLNRRQARLYDAITEGDDKARKAAHQQIASVSENVKLLERRVGQLEKDVAAMPTREQFETSFNALRDLMERHNRDMTARIDRLLEVREEGR
jgi:cell fate (sporulation/competence/biofilm development) regulator YmcA (YheA/YmcA/DUF963 family)